MSNNMFLQKIIMNTFLAPGKNIVYEKVYNAKSAKQCSFFKHFCDNGNGTKLQ